MLSHLVVAQMVLAAKAPAKSSGANYTLFILLALFGVFYFLVIRPRSQRQKQTREQLRAAEVGDEVQTIGGLVGTIVAEDGDRVTISTGNGTELTFIRQAIGKKLEPAAADAPGAVDATEFEGPPPGFDGGTESGEPDTK